MNKSKKDTRLPVLTPPDTKPSLEQNQPEAIQNMLLCLQTLEVKNQQLAEFQQRSYAWHLQHHENIKRIINGINILSESLEKLGIPSQKLQVHENKNLVSQGVLQEIATPQVSSICSFHETILRLHFENDTNELERLVSEIDKKELFRELNVQSATVLMNACLRLLLKAEQVRSSLICLYELHNAIPDAFLPAENKQVLRKICASKFMVLSWLGIEGLSDNLEQCGMEFDDLHEIYNALYKFVVN